MFSLVKDDDGEYTVSSSDFSRSGTVMANRYGEDGWQILWFNAQNVKTNGTLFTLQMKVRENAASGSYPIHISYSPKDTVTEDGVQTPLACVDGSIEVQGMPAGKADSEAPAQNGADGGTGAFPDVPKTHWAYLYIQGLAEKKIVSGDRSGRFHPESSVTRAQFVKMLAGVMGADLSNYAGTKFSDVSDGSWAAPYIAWAAENGIVNGTGETTFSPDAPITREQIAAPCSAVQRDSGSHCAQTPTKRHSPIRARSAAMPKPLSRRWRRPGFSAAMQTAHSAQRAMQAERKRQKYWLEYLKSWWREAYNDTKKC